MEQPAPGPCQQGIENTMPALKFTDLACAKAGPGIWRDTDRRTPSGTLLQVTANGSRAYRFEYRRKGDGKQRRMTLGDVSA